MELCVEDVSEDDCVTPLPLLPLVTSLVRGQSLDEEEDLYVVAEVSMA